MSENELLATKSIQSEINRLSALLHEKNAVLIAHYYVDPQLQQLADQSGGFVGDSLAMAQFGLEHSATTLVVAGVRFMGESAKILSPAKRVLMPTLDATCSLDIGCPIDSFSQFCDEHPDRTIVVYANTSAAVKARADWVVTSSNAVDIVDYLDADGKKILWAPDRYLGKYIQKHTHADMLIWDGSCIVHEEFKVKELEQLKAMYPHAAVLVHPESPPEVVALADVVGSTSKLLKASIEMGHEMFIVATERGIFYKMREASPNKTFIEAPTQSQGATCRACARCPWMQMNTLQNLESTLQHVDNEIRVSAELGAKARVSLGRMIDFCS